MTKEERETFEKLTNDFATKLMELGNAMEESESNISVSIHRSGTVLRQLQAFLKDIGEEKQKNQKKEYMWKE